MYYIQALFLLLSLILTFSFFIYGFNHYFLLGVNSRYRLPGIKKENFSKRPFVDVQLPIFNERYVVKRLVSACAGMVERYGTTDAQITILDDSTDDTVQIVDEVVREFTHKGIQINVQRRPTRQGYKAGALQLALESTSAEYLAIFDADYTPPEDFLIRTIPYFLEDDTLGIIQSRWTHLNRWFNPITRAVAIGIDVHFFIEQTGRYATGCFLNFNGSGGVLRRSALMQAGGWQSDTLAEDLDASYRMQMKGYHVLFIQDLSSPGEIPPTVPSFKKQQARWANGSLRTAKKLLPHILADGKLKPYQRLEAFIHLTGYMLHPMMFTSFLLASFSTFFRVDTFLLHSQLLTPLGGTYTSYTPAMAGFIHRFSWGLVDSMILLSMVAAWISPVVSLRLQHISVRQSIPSLVVLFFLGSGISVSNSIEAVKALFTNRNWEFKRTPKYANLQNKEGWRSRKYQVPLDFVFLLELASVCLGLVATAFAFLHSHFGILIILIPYTASYFFIAYLTYKQSGSKVKV